MERTASQQFLLEAYGDMYQQRHPILVETGEDALISSFVPEMCPHCQSKDIKRFGQTRNHIQRYRCLDCAKTFTPVTGTIFEGHKISIREWMDYTLNIFRYADDFWKDYGSYVRMRADETPGAYTDSSFEYNRFGDILVSRPFDEADAPRQDVSRSGGAYVFTDGVLTQRGMNRLCGIYDSLRDRGVTVLVSYAPVNRDGLPDDGGAAAFEVGFTGALAERGWSTCSSLADYLLPGRYFFDSDYHLNEGGALIRTKLLIRDIADALR